MKCDVRKEEDILSMMSEVKSQLGGADICVNNAGLSYDSSLLSGTTEQWKEMLEVKDQGHTSAYLLQGRLVGQQSKHLLIL